MTGYGVDPIPDQNAAHLWGHDSPVAFYQAGSPATLLRLSTQKTYARWLHRAPNRGSPAKQTGRRQGGGLFRRRPAAGDP
jgi:hypothetical protein